MSWGEFLGELTEDEVQSGAERWRVRETGGVDVTIHVGRKDGLAVVTSVGRLRLCL